jgi:hypothetical protein
MKSFLSTDKAEVVATAWKIYLEANPDLLEQCLDRIGPEKSGEDAARCLIQTGWMTGFFSCMRAFETGAILTLSAPVDPKTN